MKRVLIVSDLHCRHLVGLTPPAYQLAPPKRGAQYATAHAARLAAQTEKIAAIQREAWAWWRYEVKRVGRVDLLIANGDLIDGTGARSGGTEEASTDRLSQVAVAVECLSIVRAKKIVMSYGTAYHAGDAEDFETLIADAMGAKIGAHEWVDVNGCVFDVKHHVGGSTIPHGRGTAIAREALWNALWAEREQQPRASVIVRSHVHYHAFCGGADWLAMTTPALQAAGTKYGARRMSGTVDFGFVVFEVDERGGYQWRAHLANLKSQAARAAKV
jgi:hypothetical protein